MGVAQRSAAVEGWGLAVAASILHDASKRFPATDEYAAAIRWVVGYLEWELSHDGAKDERQLRRPLDGHAA